MVTEQQLKEIIKKLWIKSVTEIPSDVVAALKRAREKETNMRAMNYLDLFIKNAELAAQKQIAVCTDTGIPTFFIKTPFGFPFTGDLRKVFNEAFHELTFGDFPMRSMVIDPLTGKDNGDNTAKNVPLIHAEIDNALHADSYTLIQNCCDVILSIIDKRQNWRKPGNRWNALLMHLFQHFNPALCIADIWLQYSAQIIIVGCKCHLHHAFCRTVNL